MSLLSALAARLRLTSIRSRILAIVLVPAFLTAFGLIAYFTTQTLINEEEALQARAATSARHLGDALAYPLITGDIALAQGLLASEVTQSRLAHAAVYDEQGTRLASVGQVPQSDRVLAEATVIMPYVDLPDDPLFNSTQSPEKTALGRVEVSLSRAPIRDFTRETLLRAALLMLAALAITGLLAWRLSDRLAGQLDHIGRVVARLAGGDLSVRTRLPDVGEAGRLAHGVNDMADALLAQRNEMEARIRAATAGLAAKKEQAERAVAAKSRFFAAASHDLRQPLHALALFVATLKARNRQPEVQPLIDNIEASSAAMELLLNSLLDISRLDAGVIDAKPVHFPIQAIFDDMDKQFSALAAEKGLVLRIRANALTLFSDPLLVERMLANFISNAIRYTESGGVLVACRRRGTHALISVYDTGCGIPPDQQQVVFQEFVQLNNPARDRSKGLGLGLAIVARLGRLLDHPVSLRSVPGRGSVFSFSVPLGDAGRIAPAAVAAVPAPALPEDALVVFIDDEAPILRGMAELFDNWGIDLVTAHDADEALEALAGLDRTPDAIVSDYRLPGDDGLAVIARLRSRFGQTLPAVLVTGDTAPETLQRIGELGLPILHKPLRPAKLRALITHLIQQSRARVG